MCISLVIYIIIVHIYVGRRWKGLTIELSCVRRDIILHLSCTNRVINVWRRWWHSRYRTSPEPSYIPSTCSWVFGSLGNPTCSECLPEEICHLNPQSTCRVCGPGPKLAHVVRAESLRATEMRARETTRGGKRIKHLRAKKRICIYSRWPYLARVWIERANRRYIGHTRYSEITTI